MPIRRFRFVLLCLFGLSVPAAVEAQTAGDFHEFTSKSGQKVTAKLLGISADKRQMKILRQDGQQFETEIVLLSLDDQQFVKDWMKNNPEAAMAKSDFRLEVTITRVAGEGRKNRENSYTMEEKDQLYRISIRNLSRETLASARLDYAVVWENAVTIYKDETSGTMNYSLRSSDEEAPQVKQVGGADLAELRFNGEEIVETGTFSIDRVLYDGNELIREDELIGVKVRVRAPDGTVLNEAESGSAAIGTLTWEAIEALEEPRKIN